MADAWTSFAEIVRETEGQPPYHLRTLVETVREAADPRSPSDLQILDHGCGGGAALLYLSALGYTGVHGIDLESGTAERWNRLMDEVLGIKEKRFFVYDGSVLPFADGSQDVIFSQQVLEHVRPAVLDTYYAEEYRVLKPGGIVVHQVPHRLAPYDSHTRTWFLHYLPHRIWRWSLRLIGRASITSETALFLRWPWIHRMKINENFEDNTDVTVDRLVGLDDFTYYDGPVGLRRAISRLVRAPIIGPLAQSLLRNLMMIDTVSRKRL
jgi:SAM-dependent methyltransferase